MRGAGLWPAAPVDSAGRPILERLRWGALAALPVVAALVAARGLERPALAVGLVAASVLAIGAVHYARREGAVGLWVALLALSILAGEMSAIPFGGQSGRLLWADVVLAIGLAWALLRQRLALEIPRAPFVWAMGPLIAWAALTLLVARDVLTGVAELKEWVVAWAVGAAAAHFAKDAHRARVLLQIVALTGSLIAVLMVYSALSSPFGWILAVLLKKVDLPWGRTNYLAGLIILALPVTVGLLGASATRLRRVLWLALLVAQSVGLALSASKGAILALVVGLVLAFASGGRSSRIGLGVMGAIIVLGVGMFALGPLRQVVEYRLQASALAYSVGERTDLYRLAWNQFERSPIWGLGINNFSVAANRLTGVDTVPHNLELGLLAELGIPGFVLAFVWLGTLARAAWRARSVGGSARERSIGLGLWAAFVAFFVHNQMESTIYGEQYKILLMLVAAAAWRLGEGQVDTMVGPDGSGEI